MRNIKLLNCSGHRFAIIVLIGCASLAQLMVTPASCQRQQATAGGTKTVQSRNNNILPMAFNTIDQQAPSMAPFFSINRDGKTSARRIQQTGGGNGSGSGGFAPQTTQQSPSTTTTTTIQPSNGNNVESTTTNSWRQSTLSNQLPQTTTASSFPLSTATDGSLSLSSSSAATEGAQTATTSSSLDSRLYSNGAALGGQSESGLSQSSAGATPASADVEARNDQSSTSGLGTGTSGGQNEMNFVQQKMSAPNDDEFNKSSMPFSDNQQQEQRQQQSDGQASQTGSFTTSGSAGSTGNDATTTTAATLSSTNGQTTFDNQTPRLVMQPLNQQLDSQQTTSTGGSSSPSSPSTISTPNSLSMSLDGMILNSRPRAPLNSASADSNSVTTSGTGNRKNNTKSKASPVSRIGESAPSSMDNSISSQLRSNLDNPSGGAKSRRVPFTGTQFSSPATKGVRTKPKANNNQMGNMINFYSQQQQQQQQPSQDTLAGVEFDSMGNQRSVSMGANQLNQLFRQQPQQADQTNSMNQGFSRTNNQMDGFGEDTQQMRLNLQQLNGMNNQQQQQQQQQPSQSDSSELELMRNLLASNGATEMRTQSVASNPNDMVMSVMSSADGKERRLVMIARDTLDSLQRFASQTGTSPAARGNQVGAGTKSSSNRPQTQQTSVSRNGRPSSGDSSSQTPSFSWTKNTNPTTNSFQQQQQQQPQATRQSGGSSLSQQQQQQQLEQQMQQEVQIQTTTSAPTSTSTGGFIGLSPVTTTTTTTTTTTQQPAIASTTTTQQPIESFSQDSQQGSQTGASNQFSTEGNNSTVDSKSGSSSDSFREVPVSTIGETNANTNSDSLQPRRQPLNGSGKQQATNTISGVKTISGSKANQQQSAGSENGQRSSARQQASTSSGSQSQKNGTNGSPSTNGKKKTTTQSSTTSSTGGPSAKQQQQPSSAGKQTQKSNGNKSGTKSSSNNGNRKSNSSSSGGQSQASKKQQPSTSVRITNGQQPVGAMLGRVFEQQQERQPQSTSSPVPPPVTRNGNKRVNTTTPDDEMGATVSSIIMSSGQATSSSSNEPEQQVSVSGQQQQQQQQPKQPRQLQATNNSSGSSKRPTQQSSSTTGSTSNTAAGQPGTTSGSRPASLPASMTTSSQTDRNQLDRELDEIERDQQQQQPGSSGVTAGNNQALVMGDNININNQQNGGTTDLRSAIPGEPQLDYPIYSSPPKTSFDCMSQSCPGGYYADIETQCQVFHICQSDGRFDTFLCPNGTIFSQQHFVCVWWWQVDCQQSAAFYKLNDGIYCNSMFPPSMSAQQTPATLPNRQQQQQFNSISSNNQQQQSFNNNNNNEGTLPALSPGSSSSSTSRFDVATQGNSMSLSLDSSSGNELSSQNESNGNFAPIQSTSSQEGPILVATSGGSATSSSSSSNSFQGPRNPQQQQQQSTTSGSDAQSINNSAIGRGMGNTRTNESNNNNNSSNNDNSDSDSDLSQQQQEQLELLSRRA